MHEWQARLHLYEGGHMTLRLVGRWIPAYPGALTLRFHRRWEWR